MPIVKETDRRFERGLGISAPHSVIEDEEVMDERGRQLAFLLLTDRFKRSAKVANFGCVDDDKALRNAGLRALTRVVGDLDLLFGVPAREALVPLLEDLDPAIRVYAAGYLLKTETERALAVLRDLNAHAPAEVRVTAGAMLRDYEKGKLNL